MNTLLDQISDGRAAVTIDYEDECYFKNFLADSLKWKLPVDTSYICAVLSNRPTAIAPFDENSRPVLIYESPFAVPLEEDIKYHGDSLAHSDQFEIDLKLYRTREEKRLSALVSFEECLRKYYSKKKGHELETIKHQAKLAEYEKVRVEFERVPLLTAKYAEGDLEALKSLIELNFEKLKLPPFFPKRIEVNTEFESKILTVDFGMPLATIEVFKQGPELKSGGRGKKRKLTEKQTNLLYDDFCYQVAICMINFVCRADGRSLLSSVVFNGIVTAPNRATGIEETNCVMSLMVQVEEFNNFDLNQIDAKECFKKLKGMASPNLSGSIPIRPILKFDKNDKRFISADSVIDSIDQSQNLAAMDWQSFETLIRDIFQKEFSGEGSEVQVTRGSKDGGVDAIVFDPDPIKGGKFVIQAKRYTNVVGVSAVRDLYGTVMNEGANRGVLVTTANFGPDAYEFCKDKPLSLISGPELLHLLKKHGYSARIDIAEAKRILKEDGRAS